MKKLLFLVFIIFACEGKEVVNNKNVEKLYVDLLILSNSNVKNYKSKSDSIFDYYNISKKEYDLIITELSKDNEKWEIFAKGTSAYLDSLKFQNRSVKKESPTKTDN